MPRLDNALPVTLEKVTALPPLLICTWWMPLPIMLALTVEQAAVAAVLIASTIFCGVMPAVTWTVIGELPPLMVKEPATFRPAFALLKVVVPVAVPVVKV